LDCEVAEDCEDPSAPPACEEQDPGEIECHDLCPEDPNKRIPGTCGCGISDLDSEGDEIADCDDLCPFDPLNDADGDGWCGTPSCIDDDDCPDEPTECEGTPPVEGDPPECYDPCPFDQNNDEDVDGHCALDCEFEADCDDPSVPPSCLEDPEDPDCYDLCPLDNPKVVEGICGCDTADTDTDGDGTADCNDDCEYDRFDDFDEDLVCALDCLNPTDCPELPGCGTDPENPACHDECPEDINKVAPGICGCGTSDDDSDGDGTADCNDVCDYDQNDDSDSDLYCALDCVVPANCPEVPACTETPGATGCADACPDDGDKQAAGICGCGTADTDTDGDGIADCEDECDFDQNNDADDDDVCDLSCVTPADCPELPGCGTEPENPACYDECPDDIAKVAPGAWGCGTPDTDTDGDGVADCNDECIYDQNNDSDDDDYCALDCKTASECPDLPTCEDEPENPECVDLCPDDPTKQAPGVCGCGTADDDSDGDGTMDCDDACPYDPLNDDDDDEICGAEECVEEASCPEQPVCSAGSATDCTDNCLLDENTDQADEDGDGIGDVCDDCVSDPLNGTGVDSDGDGTGDACDICPFDPEDDVDEDGICGGEECVEGAECPENPPCTEDNTEGCYDNCDTDPNPDQIDTDGDGLGDACDPCPFSVDNDADQDGVCGPGESPGDCEDRPELCDPCEHEQTEECADNCPDVENPDQEDIDDDGIGDACDVCPADPDNDSDEDGVCTLICIGDGCVEAPCEGEDDEDCEDNCPDVSNPDQLDSDLDGIGDACEPDCDDELDPDCDEVPNDGDDSGDPDDNVCEDGETVDCDDNCPDAANSSQADSDDDGLGDACDNCPDAANADQADLDEDELGDVCDDDADGDGILVDDDCDDLDAEVGEGEMYYPDSDGDGIGDGQGILACAGSSETEDLVTEITDNCPDDPNPDQADHNNNGIGDVCEGYFVGGGGCTGCAALSAADHSSSAWVLVFGGIALLVMTRRRRRG